MAEAIFGLIGVVVGALITGGMSFWSERRKESAELRSALRVFDDELNTAAAGLRACLERKLWHPRIAEIALTEWTANRPILAARLNSIDWIAATAAAAAVTTIVIRGEIVVQDNTPVPFVDDDEELLAHALETIQRVRGILGTIHSPEPTLFGLLMWARQERRRAKAGVDTSPPRRKDAATAESDEP